MASAKALKLPDGFVNLAAARQMTDGEIVSVMGVVTDAMPARPSTKGDLMISFKLLDRSLADSISGLEGFLVRFFRPSASSNELPKVENVGDIVMLRGIKISTFASQRLALSSSRRFGSALIFAKDQIPEPAFAMTYMGGQQKLSYTGTPNQDESLTIAEQMYVIDLKHAMRAEMASCASTVIYSPRVSYAQPAIQRRLPEYEGMGPKFKLIRDMQFPGWSDLCGQVIKTFSTRYGGYDLYITDYTANKKTRYYAPPEEAEAGDSHRDGDLYGHLESSKAWPGPWGRLVLKVNVKEPHARYVDENVRPGDWVWLRNVKSRDAPDSTLEGDMWPDHLNLDKVCVRKSTSIDPAVQRALERKEQYWSDRKRHAEREARPGQSADAENMMKRGAEVDCTRLTNREKRRRRKEKERRKAANAEQENPDVSRDIVSTNALHDKIRCSHEHIPITRIRDILDPDNKLHVDKRKAQGMEVLPFVNVRYRTRVRVVDFEPRALEDFAVLAEHDASVDTDRDMPSSFEGPGRRYEWYFALCLENVDASTTTTKQAHQHGRLWVHLHHDQAQYLLGNRVDDPDNLRTNRKLLHQLRERLFVLWGNLEEAKGKELSNRPFECCVMEYGVEMDDTDAEKQATPRGWKRMYGMFGTTII